MDADLRLLHVLEREYPFNCRVEVFHPTGRYTGRVRGWDHHGCRVAVTNEATGKTTKRWSAHVQCIREEQP